MTIKIQLCPTCQFDGGQHYEVDDDGRTTVTRPHHDAAFAGEREADAAREAAALAHTEAADHARRIIVETARVLPYLSANDVRHRMETADIPKPIIGNAFAQVIKEGGVLVADKLVAHAEPHVRHRIMQYRSLLYRESRSVAS